MSGGKDLQAMFRDVERRVTEGVNQDDGCHSEPTEEPALPQPSVIVIEPGGVIRLSIDLEREWSVLESGVNMMCHATNAEDRQHGWHRYTSALKFLKKYTMGRQPDATLALDVDSLATALAQKLRLPPVLIPTPREIAREVLDTVKPLIPPANPNLAVQIAELVAQLQSPTYSPIHDAAAIAEAILEKLRSCVNMSLCIPAQVTELPPEPASQPMEETFEDPLPDEESDHPAQERQCIACNRNRAHNSRLWCEACRMFLRRSRKATAEGHPFTCNNAHHKQRPDTTNCRGCRAKKLDALEAEILHPEDSDDADEGIGFRRGGECNPRVPPLRITVNRSPLKRARARSAASTPAVPPVPGPSFAQSAPVAPPVPKPSFAQSTPAAPPVALPLRAQAQKHRLAPPKPKDPRAHP
ncbi:hypothetical protein GE061_015200 [Apolygus lucorum]|uniref:Uncharacterized protein n=1 Tax=Apolygus lucorum TaxID=248454 RepID=A0A8S9XKE5_APOLU|nr:hypothetical protein GE061_015200 [Apolygus lucorum]